MTGFVYFVQSVDGGPVKIGWAKDADARLGDLQCGSPVRLCLRAARPGTIADERALHRTFAIDRLHGEWFTPSAHLEREAGVRLRSHGAAVRPENGGPALPLCTVLDERYARVFWAWSGADGWASSAHLAALGWLDDRKGIGAVLQALSNRGLLVSRRLNGWTPWSNWSTRQWAPWWLRNEHERAPRSAGSGRRVEEERYESPKLYIPPPSPYEGEA